ncbi:MAG: hypothetical protein AAF531_05230 [Actinomycetota bacterium]
MPPLYFLHIPKTSGTTLTAYLDARFSPSETLVPKVWSQHLANLGPADRSPFARSMRGTKLIRGHFGRGVWRELDERPAVITMLREPVERTISLFHHVTVERRWNNFTPADFYREPFSLDAVLGDERARVLANHQVRHLGVDIDVKAIARSAANAHLAELNREPPNPVNLDTLAQFIEPELSPRALLDSAFDYLRSVACFGLQEFHQASVLLLADTFGWPAHRVADRLMTIHGRPGREQYAEPTIEAVMANNTLDITLYRRAHHLFFSRYAELASRLIGEPIGSPDLIDNEPEITARCLDRMLGGASEPRPALTAGR